MAVEAKQKGGRRMLADLFIGRPLDELKLSGRFKMPPKQLGLLLLALLVASGWIPAQPNSVAGQEARNAIGKRPYYFSEYKLRSSIESFDKELRELKRGFVRQTSSIYLSLKSDPQIGLEQAKQRAAPAALAAALLAEQFADLVVKSYLIRRRLLAGLKVAYVKFLPLATLKRLAELSSSFAWLRNYNQVDLRPLFPRARENQFAQLYSLIALRARLRAADDLITLSASNIRRILKIAERYLGERRQMSYVTNSELNRLASFANKVLSFYLDEVVAEQRAVLSAYERQLSQALPLASFVGGQTELVKLIDRLIDTEALDIDLSREATKLHLPPTISETIMVNLERRWVPGELLEALQENRRVLLENKQRIVSLVRLAPEQAELRLEELEAKCAAASLYICKNYPLNL